MSSSCLQGQVRFGGEVLLFILGSRLGGVGPVRGLRGGGRGGWCEESLDLWRGYFAEPQSPTGPEKLFKEVTAAHVGCHC
jgi:hypothetical protein